jgi:DNA replication and repair protein RecF
MRLRSLYVSNFRLYAEERFTFSPDDNFICGPNAVGKTSLLEAIYFLISGRSFRTHYTANLIRHGAAQFFLDARFSKRGVGQRLRIAYSKKERKIWLNNTLCPSASGLFGVLLGVVLAPDDLNLIVGPPQERRQYLDSQLAQVDPLYLYHLTRYARAMRQRNHLLKAKAIHSIEGWEWEMAISATYIAQRRAELLAILQGYAHQSYSQLLGARSAEQLLLAYRCSSGKGDAHLGDTQSCREHYLGQFHKNRPRELLLAATVVGPHKDDIALQLGDKEVRAFASEGQMRSCAAALRLAEWHALRQAAEGEDPLMLIDDFGISLDSERSRRLLSQLEGVSQLFITSTVPLERGVAARQALSIIPHSRHIEGLESHDGLQDLPLGGS